VSNSLPLAPGLPYIGSIFSLAKEAQFYFFDQHQTLGNVFRVRSMGKDIKIMAGAEANIFVATDADAFTAWDTWEGLVGDFGAKRVLTMVDGPEHSRMRKLMRQSFSRDALERELPAVSEHVFKLVREQPLNKPVPAAALVQRITADVLGMLSNRRLPGEHFDDIVYWWTTLVEVYLARISPKSKLQSARYLKARARTREFVEGVVSERLAAGPRAEDDDGDFIDNMLAASAADPGFLSRDEVLFHALAGYFAGLDTVANVTSFMLYELLRDPALLSQARAEADALFAAGVPEAKAFRAMPVTHAVAMETLRLYPVAGTLFRNAARDFEFGGHHFVKGEAILVASAATHFTPKYFADPKRFDITRYSAPRNEHRVRGVYAPFGSGPHTCLGAGLAEVQIMLTVAAMLHATDFVIDPPGYKLQKAYIPSLTPKGMCLRFSARRVNCV
jgi:cytochrome P450